MSILQRFLYSPDAAAGLCRTCSWGTVRTGFFKAQAETFCRLVGPSSRLRYPVRECTGYCDRRMPDAVGGERKYGFVTEIKLESGGVPAGPRRVAEPFSK